MKKLKLYIETSVWSFLFADDAPGITGNYGDSLLNSGPRDWHVFRIAEEIEGPARWKETFY